MKQQYFDKITACMMGIKVQVDDESYASVEGLRIVYGIVNGAGKLITDGACAFQFDGVSYGGRFGVKVCDLSQKNRAVLDRYFKDELPAAFL